MWPVILTGLRTYAPYLVFPAALTIGTIGYFFEYHLSDRKRGRIQAPSTLEQRSERKLTEKGTNDTTNDLDTFKASLPKSILDRNLNNPDNYK